MDILSEIVEIDPDALRVKGPGLLWPEEPDQGFVESVRVAGIMDPVLVEETGGGYRLAAGYKRVRAAGELGVRCPARMVCGSAVELATAYVASNAARIGNLGDGRLLLALGWFARNMGRDEALDRIGPLLGLRAGSRRARMFSSWLDMPEPLMEHALAERLPLACIGILERMDKAERQAVAPFFAPWAWSRNNGLNFLTWVLEAARAAGGRVEDLLGHGRYSETLRSGLSPKDGAARLCETARRDRYPTVTRLREEFAAASRELRAGTSWKIDQPDNFETTGVELTVRIKDARGLEQAVSGLADMAKSRAWERLWAVADDA